MLPKGGLGNLIALPLQKLPRERGCSVFVDEQFTPYADQWVFLTSIRTISTSELENAISQATCGRDALDIAFAGTEEEEAKPWKRPKAESRKISGTLPESLTFRPPDFKRIANLISIG
jgi:hypothetical protein